MAILIKLINDYNAWIYGVCAIVALFLLRAAILARRDRMQATFSLEREAARNHEYRIVTFAAIVQFFLGGIYAVEKVVIPNVKIPYEPTPAATTLFLPTITPTPAPPTATPTITPTLVRPTARPQLPTATPTAPAPGPAACPNPAANLTSPGNRAQVKGVVSIAGTAAIDRFQFYKLELGPGENPTQWSFLFSGDAPVLNRPLGSWDTSALPAGVYALRLVVVDQTGNFPDPCTVVVSVVK